MSTEADKPEPITITKREGEIIYPGSGHVGSTDDETFSGELKKFQGVLNVPPATVEYLGETKDMQAANNFGAEAMNTAIKFNVETAEGERYLGSPSAVQVSIDDTCRVSKNSETEEVTLQAGIEAPENGKQTQSTSNIEVAGERGTEENKVTEDSQEKPVEDKSNEKETSDIHNYETDRTMTDENTDLGSKEQVVKVLEAASDRNKEDLIHVPDPTVISLNKSVETVMEPCVKAESKSEVKFTGEEMRETSSTEAEKSSNLTDEVPEVTKPVEGVADENEEKEKSTYGGAEDIFTSTTEIQRNEEATLKIKEGDNEMLDTQSATLETGVYEAGPEESVKLIEASSILCKEKSQDETEPSKDIMNNKNSIDTPAMQTEGKDIVKESPEEVDEQIEMTDKTAGKDYESPDQKGDGSILKDEDTSSIYEVLPAKEASFGGKRYEEESTITATKDDVTEREITDTSEQTRSGTTNHEDRPENLPQEKPEKEKLEGSVNLFAEEFNKAAETEQAEAVTSVKEETPIKSHEESFEKEMQIDLAHHTDANVNEFDEKTECAEVEAQKKKGNDLHDIPVLDEEAGETDSKDLEKVFKNEPKGTIQEANKVYAEEEEKHVEDASEACQSSNSTIIEQTSLEEAESAELILKASETDETKLQEASRLDFDKTSVIMDNRENTDQEMQKIGEACDVVTDEILGNSVDAETSVEVNNAVFLRDEKADQNIQVERSPLEVAPELTGQDESGIAGDNEKRNNITHEEVHDRTKIIDGVVASDEQIIEGNVAHISPESIEKPNVESSKGNMAESSEGQNNIEQATEDSNIRCLAPESVEEDPVKNLEEEPRGEIPEKSDTAEATDSIGQGKSKNKESPEEIVDDSKVKGDTLLTGGRNLTPAQTSLEEKTNEDTNPAMVAEESGHDSEPADVKDDNGKNTSKTVEDLNPISQKNEPGEELPQSLSKISDKNEAFNSDADKSPGDVEEGPTQKLEEALRVEENEKAEMKNDSEYSKTATEEASVELETTSVSEVAENQTIEMEKNVDQPREVEEKKIEESIQEDENVAEISEQGNDAYISQVSGEFEEGKSEKYSQEDAKVPEVSKQGNDTHISPLSIEQETLENIEGNIHKEEKSEGENNGHHNVEDNNSRGLIPESEPVEQSPIKNLENDKMEKNKSTEEIFDNSEALRTTESSVSETSTTIESTTEILDPSLGKQGDSSQNEENQLTAVEPSAEDKRNENRGPAVTAEENSNENELLPVKDNSENKPSIGQEDSKHILQENELQEKNERSLSVGSNENEESILDADKSPCLMEIGTQDLNEAPWKEDIDEDTEEKNDTKDNQIAMEKNHEINAEPSDASKATASAVTELKSEKDQMLVQDKIKKGESEELYEDSNDGVKNEKECSTTDKLPEPIGEESLPSSKEDEKEEETPENQASVELKTTSGSEDSEKQTLKVEKNADQSREIEEEEIELSSQEDDVVAEMSKQGNDTYISPVSIEKETFENSNGTKFKEEKTEGKNSREQNVEENNSGGLIPESVYQSPLKNLEDDRMREDKSTREIFENSMTSGEAEIAAHETSTTIDNSVEILHSSLVKQVDSVQNEENNLKESSAEEKINEDRGLVILAEGNSNDNEPIGAKDNIEKQSSMGKEDLQHIQHENEPAGKHERLSFVMSDKNEDFSTNADKSPSLMEVEASRDLNEAPQKEDNDKETGENVDTEDNKIVDEENHEIVAKSSDASKSTDVLDLTSEEEKTLVHDEIKEEVSKELYEDTKNAEICNTEDIMQHSKQDASSSLVEGGLSDKQSKDQVDESISFIEETEAASSAEETVCTTLKITAAESNEDSCPLDITKDSEAETQLNETNGSLIEVPVRVSQMSNKETEEEMKEKEKEEITIGDSESASITMVAQAEPEEKKQAEIFGPAFEEKGIVETETKLMVLESADINEKPEKESNLGEKSNNQIPAIADNAGETNGVLIQESAMASHISSKETEEEIKETEDTSIEDSDSVSVTVVTEAKGLQEAEPEEQKHLESFRPAFRENDIAKTESNETMLESVDMNVKPEHTSDLGEKRDREIPKVADEDREITDCKIQNDAPHAGDEDQTEKTTKDKPLEEISKDELKENSTMKSRENELSTAEVIESVDKPPAQDDVPNVNTETACVAQAIDETFLNKQDNTTNPVNVSELEPVDIQKEAANEEIQKHENEDLHVHPELENAKNLSMSEVVKTTKGELTGKLADQGDICKLTTLKDLESLNLEVQMEKTEDGKPFDEVLKTSENSGLCTQTEKDILEQEIFKRNLKKVIELEDTGIEQKGEAPKDEFLRLKLGAAENQTTKKFAESEKSQVEENSCYKSNQEYDKEIMEKEEPQLEAEDHKEQNANKTTKAVILTEKDGVEQSDDSEDIKEMITEEECVNAFNDALSTVGEKTDKMKDSAPVCRENKKAADLNEKTKTENPDIGEDSAREGEPSFGKESEEQKEPDISIEPSAKDLKENTGEIIEEPQDCYCKIDNASLSVETDKGSGKADIEEKLVKVFHIDSDEPSLEATETKKCQEGKEVCSLRLGETSESLMNDSGHAERECAIENRDADEPEESKIASEESKSRNAEEAEVGKSQTVEIPDQVPTDNDDHAAVENPGLDAIEETKIAANEVNEVKEISDSVYESKDQVTEEAEVEESQTVQKPNQVPPNDGDNDDAERQHAAMENTGSDEAEETKIVSNAVDETKDQLSKETAENGTSSTVEKMDHTPSSNFEHVQEERIAVENPNADEVNEIKVAPDATYESNERDNGESAGEIPTIGKLDQAPPANSEPVQYSNAEEVEESEIASILASKSKDQSTEDIDMTGKNTTQEKPDTESTEEACKAASNYRAQAIEPVTENEITTDQTPSAEKTNAQMAPKHETTATVEKIEEEKQQKVEKLEDEGPEDSSADKPTEEVCLQTEGPRELEVSTMGFKINKGLQDNPTEAYEEEGHTPDGALEPWGIENKLKSTDASSESKALQSEAVIHSQEEVTESEDTEIKEKHLIEVISEVRTEENQCKKTIEGNEITETKVSKEEITEEKEVEKTCQPVSICEGMNQSLEDDGQKAEECRGDETNNAFKTTVNKIQYEELLEETEKASASLNIGRRDVAKDMIVEDSRQVSEENMIAKEGCPNESEGKEAGDSAIKLDANTQGEDSNYGSGKAEATTLENEESSMAMSKKESIRGFATDSKIIQGTSELEQSSCATAEKHIPTEADLIERPYPPVQSDDEFSPKFGQQGTTETPKKAKISLEGEQQPQESGERITEELALMDSATASLTDLLQSSRIETTKVAEQVDKGREPTGSTEDKQTKESEAIHVEDAKMDEEQDGDEHKRTDSSSDAPVMIEATRDAVDVKVAHKKSHNILSGVGSKVKHSISKVKKAITGKSSHPKSVSPK